MSRNGEIALPFACPRAVVEALDLKEGDDIEIVVAGKRRFEVEHDRSREIALAKLKELRWPYRRGSSSIATRRMSVKPFLHTNILVYAVASEDRRSTTARALIANGGVVSLQVLNDLVNVARCKLRRDWTQIEGALGLLRRLLDPSIALTVDIHEWAIALARQYRLAFYDALIVAAASKANCSVLFSEDMQDGERIGGLTIRNPFLAA